MTAPGPGFTPGVGMDDATMLIERIAIDSAVRAGSADSPGGAGGADRAGGAGGVDNPGGADSADRAERAGSADGVGGAARDDISGMKTARTGGVARVGAMMAVATLASRLTGFVAKAILLGVLGATIVSDAYNIANTLPNIVFELLIGGVLTSVAIPLLSRARSDPDGGEAYTQRLMTLAFVGLIGTTGLALLAAPLLTRLYLSGNSATSDPGLATQLAYLLLPQILFYGMAALFGAILNTKERFAAPAWAPLVNNLVLIVVGVVVALMPGDLPRLTPAQLLVLGLGTTAGIVLQAVVMLPSLFRSGFRFKWRFGWDHRMAEAGTLALWAVVYVLVSQVGYIVTTRVASGNVEGGITVYGFASLLFQLPYGIIGVSVLTAIMPRMSRHAAAGAMDEVKNDASLAHRLSTVALMPVAAAMVALSGALALVSASQGNVDPHHVLTVGGTLAALAIGLVPLAMTLIQMRVFYAMKDARTPTIINAIMVAVRIPLLLMCVQLRPDLIIVGLAVATTVSYLVGAVVGECWLAIRYGPMGTSRTLITVVKAGVASATGGAAAFFTVKSLFGLTPKSLPHALAQLGVGSVVGLLVVVIGYLVLRVEEFVPLRRRIGRLLGRVLGRSGRGTLEETSSDLAVSEQRPHSAVPTPPAVPPPAVQPPIHQPSAVHPAPPISGAGIPFREQVQRPVTTGESNDPTVPATGDTPSRPHDSSATVAVQAGPDGPTVSGTAHDGGPSVAPAHLAPGSTVGGRYRLITQAHTDAAGNQFWRARDLVLPRDMALTLLPETSAVSATVARTLRAGRLHHIGLPQTLDVGSDHGYSYVVGQWVEGATLTDLVADGPLTPDVATSITAKVSEAVAEAHRNGIALGAISPTLVRVNIDGQVRFSHVIAHSAATPDQDIRSIGGMLYLMLTGTWPLPEPVQIEPGRQLPAAPTQSGTEISADQANPEVPAALAALASRALHPEDPDGIHAIGAIATLLRQPEVAPAPAIDAPAETVVRSLSSGERRLIKERRVKLAVGAVMLAILSALIIIVVASVAKQVSDAIADPEANGLGQLDVRSSSSVPAPTTVAPSGAVKPSAGAPSAAGSQPAPTTAAPPVAPPVPIIGGAVYDPQGEGKKDYEAYFDRAFDGDPNNAWLTWEYKQQFGPGGIKDGVGLAFELEREVSPSSVTVSSSLDTPNTTVEIRTANSLNPPLAETTVLGSGTITSAPVTITLANAPKSKYLIVFVTKLAEKQDAQGRVFQSSITEVSITGQ